MAVLLWLSLRSNVVSACCSTRSMDESSFFMSVINCTLLRGQGSLHNATPAQARVMKPLKWLLMTVVMGAAQTRLALLRWAVQMLRAGRPAGRRCQMSACVLR
jgi:hypothetical protein